MASLALDENDNPHIAHGDIIRDVLRYTTRVNGTWHTEIVDDTDLVGDSPSIAIDSAGRVHIAYAAQCPHLHPAFQSEHPGPKNTGLRYAVRNGGGWDLSTVDYGVWGAYPWLVIDSNDRPHIAYGDWNHRGIYYARWDGVSWQRNVVDLGASMYSALALDSKGYPHVVFGKSGSGLPDLYYARWNGTSWKLENLGPDGFIITRTAIAIDEFDQPHIIWGNRTGRTSYAMWNGTWSVEDLPGSGGSRPSIVVHQRTLRVLIQYTSIYYGVRENGAWSWEIVNASRHLSVGDVGGKYIAVDSEGVPHVAGTLHTGYSIILGYISRSPGSFDIDAGQDQIVNEGEVAKFHGSGPEGATGWSPRANIPSSTAGGSSAVIEVMDEMYYLGGDSSDLIPGPSTRVQKYNTLTDTWSDFIDLPEKRAFLGSAFVGWNLYAFGGNDGNSTVKTTYVVDPRVATWPDPQVAKWRSAAPMPVPMEAFGVAVVGYRIYILGGTSTWLNCTYCGSVFEYDTFINRWSRKADMPTPRKHLAAAVVNGAIYAIGGLTDSASDAVEVYDPINDKWEARTALPTARWGLSAQVLRGKIHALGGIVNWDMATNVDEIYDPSSDEWSPGDPMIDSRMEFGSGAIGNCIYVMGGYRGWMAGHPSNSEAYCMGGALDYVWDFDGSVDSDGDGNLTNDIDSSGQDASTRYGDEGIYIVTLRAFDGNGSSAMDTMKVTVLNLPPTIGQIACTSGHASAEAWLRIAGEKWHDVRATLHSNGIEIGNITIVRRPGSPNNQEVFLGTIDTFSNFTARIIYTPEDDAINGQKNGATPAWILLRQNNGDGARLHHTFNIRHPDTWIWNVENLEEYMVRNEVICTATATDPGSDDLTFTWDWGDGFPATATTYYNDGIGPDPYPSVGGTFPFTATDIQIHVYLMAGTYEIKLTASDDDGGAIESSIIVFIV